MAPLPDGHTVLIGARDAKDRGEVYYVRLWDRNDRDILRVDDSFQYYDSWRLRLKDIYAWAKHTATVDEKVGAVLEALKKL